MPASVAEPISLQVDAMGLALVVRAATEEQSDLWGAALEAPVTADRVTLLLSPAVAARGDLLTAAAPLIIERLDDCELDLLAASIDDPELAQLTEEQLSALEAATGRQVTTFSQRPATPFIQIPMTPPVTDQAGPAVASWTDEAITRPRPVPSDEAGPTRIDSADAGVYSPQAVRTGPAFVPAADVTGSERHRLPAGTVPEVTEAAPATEIVLPGPTGAGWSFAADGDPLIGAHPAGGCFVVQVAMVGGAVRLDDRPVRPGTLADRIRECPGWQGRQVLVVPVDGAPPAAAGLYLGPLADALGVGVVAADAMVRPDGDGGLVTTGSFRRWSPRTGGTSEPRLVDVLGAALPAQGESPVDVLEPTDLPAHLVALLTAEWVPPALITGPEAPWTVLAPAAGRSPTGPASAESGVVVGVDVGGAGPGHATDRPGEDPVPPSATAGGARFTSAVPVVVRPADPGVLQVPQLRAALAEDYDRHARYATRVLAEQPALRLGADPKELLAALVALRAYCVRDWAVVNSELRGTAEPDPAGRVTTIAAWARHGLARCPTELGPVLTRTPADPAAVARYRPGLLLREPGFLDAVAGNPATDGAVEFAIWSLTGRRLGRFGPVDTSAGRADAVLFGPGTGFEVLAVDPATDGATAVRVLLRELPAGRHQPLDQHRLDRILARLRACGSTPDGQPPAERSPALVGFGPDDLPYPFAIGEPDDGGALR